MKYLKYLAFIGVGLSVGILIRRPITKYISQLTPWAIALIFAVIFSLLSIRLKKKYELFRVQYRAYENANLYLTEFDKNFRAQRIIFTQYPFSLPPPPEILRIGWDYNEKITDSLSKMASSFITLKGFFSSREFKKSLGHLEKNWNELIDKSFVFQKIWQTEYPQNSNGIEAYKEKIIKSNLEIEQTCKDVISAFENLRTAIFKEMKIP